MVNNIAWAKEIMAERHGYKNITDEEALLFEDLGEDHFYKVIDFAFRIAYWTIKHKELDPKSEQYKTYFREARKIAVENALDLTCQGRKDYVPLMFLTDGEIVNNAKKQLSLEVLARSKVVNCKRA